MNDFLGLYRNLTDDIRDCEKQHTDLKKCVECCFHVCEIACLQLKRAKPAAFETEEEKIDFYKNMQPLFTGYVEFYSILYSAELFAPDTIADHPRFWKEELGRSIQFLERHRDFCEYLDSGDRSLDREYFADRSGAATEQDTLLAQIRGRQRYIAYLRERFPGL